jgi:hypothetical protein
MYLQSIKAVAAFFRKGYSTPHFTKFKNCAKLLSFSRGRADGANRDSGSCCALSVRMRLSDRSFMFVRVMRLMDVDMFMLHRLVGVGTERA